MKKKPKYKRQEWTEKEIEELIELFPHVKTETLTDKFNRNYRKIANKAHALNLKKSEEFMQSNFSGTLKKGDLRRLATQFKKGHIPPNKGKKWKQYMSAEARENALKTTFQKGHLPHNTKTDFEITIRKDKSGRYYKFIRIAKGKWVMLHVYNWEKVHGKVPKGKLVVFKTKSTEDCSIENLELITREENMRRNTIHRYPLTVKKAIRMLNKLKRSINVKEQNNS